MKRKESNLKVRRNFIVMCVIACIVGIAVLTSIIAIKKNEDTKVANLSAMEGTEDGEGIVVEGTTQKQEEQGTPKALTEIKAREPNTDNFNYVTSEDGYQVPVPKGYVGSSVEDERYVYGVNGTETYYFTSDVELTTQGDYPWTQTNGIWKSGNKGKSSSSSGLLVQDLSLDERSLLKIVASVSSQKNEDCLEILIYNVQPYKIIFSRTLSGTDFGNVESTLKYFTEEVELEAGTYIMHIKYRKNSSTNEGLDTAYIKSVKLYTKEETGNEEVQHTKRVHSGGFVIYEGTEEVNNDNLATAKTNRNQYVFVPINESELLNMYRISGNLIYGNKYNFTATGYSLVSSNDEPAFNDNGAGDREFLKQYLEGISSYKFLEEMREEFYNMLVSVKTYGGFYIGRYETAYLNTKKPVVRKGNGVSNVTTWLNMYKNCRNLKGANKSVQTGIVWGIQWDETLKWLIDSGDKSYIDIIDSSNWGNYTNNFVGYNGQVPQETGYSDYWKANNIYDLAGNKWEYSMEGQGYSKHILRGCTAVRVTGYEGDQKPVYSRGTDGYVARRTDQSCRVVLTLN